MTTVTTDVFPTLPRGQQPCPGCYAEYAHTIAECIANLNRRISQIEAAQIARKWL